MKPFAKDMRDDFEPHFGVDFEIHYKVELTNYGDEVRSVMPRGGNRNLKQIVTDSGFRPSA